MQAVAGAGDDWFDGDDGMIEPSTQAGGTRPQRDPRQRSTSGAGEQFGGDDEWFDGDDGIDRAVGAGRGRPGPSVIPGSWSAGQVDLAVWITRLPGDSLVPELVPIGFARR